MFMSPRASLLSGMVLSGLLLSASIIAPFYSQSSFKFPASTGKPFLNALEAKFTQTESLDISNARGNGSQPASIARTAAGKAQPEIIEASRGNSDSSAIVDYALSFLGGKYVYGGITPKGFDCSGFAQYVFAKFGISLPRTSYTQFASGASVSKNKLQPGDLVFFSISAKGASHVGIYIGGGRFIHADNPRVGVTITSLSDSFYASRYLGARSYD